MGFASTSSLQGSVSAPSGREAPSLRVPVNTPTNASVVEGGESVERAKKGSSLGRMGEPDEIADVVAFLFSNEARYMNGSVVEIDGGIRRTSF